MNTRQKIAIIPNNTQLKTTIEAYLLQGFVIHQVLNLAPVSNNIFIIYYDPAVDV